jgi:hypothetical protein
MHTASGARPRGPAWRVADRRHPISCVVASANARYGTRKRRLAPLGRSSTICRQCLEALGGAWRRVRFRQGIAQRAERQLTKTTTVLPQRGGNSGTVPVQLHIHRPRHRAPPGSLAAILVARRSTPNSTARRPTPTVPRACSHTQVRRVSYYSTVPASACQAAQTPPTEAIEPPRGPPALAHPRLVGSSSMRTQRTQLAATPLSMPLSGELGWI